MKFARLAVLGVAVVAGLLAWWLAGNLTSEPPPTIVRQEVETDEVLVASRDIAPGSVVKEDDLSWESWPTSTINEAFVRRSAESDARKELAGSVARTSFFSGEPIRNTKLVKSGAGGYLSAVLPSGMRAVSTRTSAQMGAGGFILPNDRVDVILTRSGDSGGRSDHVSETILENIRVLAIDQMVEEKDGKMAAVGDVATLELTAAQAEELTRAQQLGSISLTLRSLLDGEDTAHQEKRRRSTINVVKFGVRQQVGTN